jgi:[protein-PII] uridylyltransferase
VADRPTELATLVASARSQAAERHSTGADPIETAEFLADGFADCVVHAWKDAASQAGVEEDPAELAIVAVGGFGRGESASFSDLDLAVVWSKPTASLEAAVKSMVRALWDAGFSLGQNVGTVREILDQAKLDTMLATALLSARRIHGAVDLDRELLDGFNKFLAKGGSKQLEERVLQSIAEEVARHGAAAQLIEPNVKRSAGGLRSIRAVEWIARLRTDKTDFEEMESAGFLASGDAAALLDAKRWLLRVRTALHLSAEKAEDVLTRAEQIRIADEWNYRDDREQLGVERFMREFLRRTTAVQEIAEDVFFRPEHRKRWGRSWIGNRRNDEDAVAPTLEEALQAAVSAAEAGKPLTSAWVARLRRHYRPQSTSESASAESRNLFLQLLDRPGQIAATLRLLHQTGLLGRLLPEFENVRCLIQFNAYHRYTVDEHTLVAVESAERLGDRDRNDLPAEIYRHIPRKGLLHLALLLHDLGKGRAEDHSEVGARIAAEVADRFELPPADRETLVFLVGKHLLLSRLAFHRDTRDPEVTLQLVREVGREAILNKLYALTVSDISAVSPEAYTPWKADLLADLYRRAASWFGDAPSDAAAEAEKRRRELWASRPAADSEARLAMLPGEVVAGLSLDAWAQLQDAWRTLDESRVAVLPRHEAARDAIALTILAKFELADGVFSKICGALAAHHLEVQSADIHTLGDGTVLDCFEVRDVHHFGAPSEERLARISATVRRVVLGELAVEDALWSMRSSLFVAGKRIIAADPVRVEIDNDCSQSCTVVDVFAMDRRGLLFTLARTLHQLNCSIEYAKIATYHDEVVDVFYVKDSRGSKLGGEAETLALREALIAAIRQLAADPRSMGF